MSNKPEGNGYGWKGRNGKGGANWTAYWKGIVSVAGLILIFYEATLAKEVNLVIVVAAMAMMGFPVARWLDKM